MTLTQAKDALNRMGVTIKKTDGEYKINYKNTSDDTTSYYTNCLYDAVNTATNYYQKKG